MENDHQGSVFELYDPSSPYGLREWLVAETIFIDIPALEGVVFHSFNSLNMYLLVE